MSGRLLEVATDHIINCVSPVDSTGSTNWIDFVSIGFVKPPEKLTDDEDTAKTFPLPCNVDPSSRDVVTSLEI
ncbi:hypothetical protein D3C75_1247110 [compost metagenome]